MFYVLAEVQVRKSVRIIRQEDLLAFEVSLYAFEPLADVAVKPGIHKGNAPAVEITTMQLHLPAAVTQGKVVGQGFRVIEKVFPDHVSPVAQTKYEIGVSIMCVITHEVPQNRPTADVDQRFRNRIRMLAQASTEAATKEHNLHHFSPFRLSFLDRKSTRLNSSHLDISYAVFCL